MNPLFLVRVPVAMNHLARWRGGARLAPASWQCGGFR